MPFIVCWKQRPAQVHTWIWMWAYFDKKPHAMKRYNELLSGPNGDFGPTVYCDQTIAEVITQHDSEQQYLDLHVPCDHAELDAHCVLERGHSGKHYMQTAEEREYTYEREVRDENGNIHHRKGDVVMQVKKNGNWRDMYCHKQLGSKRANRCTKELGHTGDCENEYANPER